MTKSIGTIEYVSRDGDPLIAIVSPFGRKMYPININQVPLACRNIGKQVGVRKFNPRVSAPNRKVYILEAFNLTPFDPIIRQRPGLQVDYKQAAGG